MPVNRNQPQAECAPSSWLGSAEQSNRVDHTCEFPFTRLLRIESPRTSIRCALWTRQSRMPSASLGSPICSCQRDTGSCEVRMVERIGSGLQRSAKSRGAQVLRERPSPSRRSPEHRCGLAARAGSANCRRRAPSQDRGIGTGAEGAGLDGSHIDDLATIRSSGFLPSCDHLAEARQSAPETGGGEPVKLISARLHTRPSGTLPYGGGAHVFE